MCVFIAFKSRCVQRTRTRKKKQHVSIWSKMSNLTKWSGLPRLKSLPDAWHLQFRYALGFPLVKWLFSFSSLWQDHQRAEQVRWQRYHPFRPHIQWLFDLYPMESVQSPLARLHRLHLAFDAIKSNAVAFLLIIIDFLFNYSTFYSIIGSFVRIYLNRFTFLFVRVFSGICFNDWSRVFDNFSIF